MAERPDDLLDAIRPIAQKVAVLLELGLRLRAVLPIRRIEGGLQVLAGMIEIEGLDTLGEDRTEVAPVVLRPIGELDQGEIGPLFEHRRYLFAERILERGLLRHRNSTSHSSLLGRTASVLALRLGVLALLCARTILHRDHHLIERDGHRDGFRGHRLLCA
jgi:hypothetical protein